MHFLCPCPHVNNVDEGAFNGFVMCPLDRAGHFPGLLSLCFSSGWVMTDSCVMRAGQQKAAAVLHLMLMLLICQFTFLVECICI